MTDRTQHCAGCYARQDEIDRLRAELAEAKANEREACALALEADGQLCDCFAHSEGECACGAWDDYKRITLDRAAQIVRERTDND